MATDRELQELQAELAPIVLSAIARGEDLSTPDLMVAFIKRVLVQNGYADRGGVWVPSIN